MKMKIKRKWESRLQRDTKERIRVMLLEEKKKHRPRSTRESNTRKRVRDCVYVLDPCFEDGMGWNL